MSQVRLTLDPRTGEGTLARTSDGSILTDDGLETVVTISLFTDAPADADDGVPNIEERRGYWADALEDDPRPIGSKLWLWQRETLTDESLKGAEKAASDALAWMVEAGAAGKVSTSVTRLSSQDDGARLVVSLYGPTGDTLYQNSWELLFAI